MVHFVWVTVWIVTRSTLKTGWKVSQSQSLSGLSCGVHSRLDDKWVNLGHYFLECHAEYTQDWMKGESISVTVWNVMGSTLKTGWKVSQPRSLFGMSCGVYSRLDERWVNLAVTVWNVMWSTLKTEWKVSQSRSLSRVSCEVHSRLDERWVKFSHCVECHVEYTKYWMKGESISVTVWNVMMWSTLKTGWKVSQSQSLSNVTPSTLKTGWKVN